MTKNERREFLRVSLISLAGAVGMSLTSCQERKVSNAENESVQELLGLFAEMPNWTGLSYDYKEHEGLSDERREKIQKNTRKREEIERITHLIARYDTRDIRAAIVEYLRQGREIDIMPEAKAFIVNKFIFDFPSVRMDSPHSKMFGGWWGGIPISDDYDNPQPSDEEIDVRWPWSEGEDGTWHITGRAGMYLGLPYDAIRHFDYYAEHFGRREVTTNSKTKGKP